MLKSIANLTPVFWICRYRSIISQPDSPPPPLFILEILTNLIVNIARMTQTRYLFLAQSCWQRARWLLLFICNIIPWLRQKYLFYSSEALLTFFLVMMRSCLLTRIWVWLRAGFFGLLVAGVDKLVVAYVWCAWHFGRTGHLPCVFQRGLGLRNTWIDLLVLFGD